MGVEIAVLYSFYISQLNCKLYNIIKTNFMQISNVSRKFLDGLVRLSIFSFIKLNYNDLRENTKSTFQSNLEVDHLVTSIIYYRKVRLYT